MTRWRRQDNLSNCEGETIKVTRNNKGRLKVICEKEMGRSGKINVVNKNSAKKRPLFTSNLGFVSYGSGLGVLSQILTSFPAEKQ